MVLELAMAQAQRGDDVEIWTVGSTNRQLMAPRLVLRHFPGRIRFSSAELRRTLLAEKNRFDAIHSHNTFLPLNLAVAAAGWKGARVFFHAHGAVDPLLVSGLNIKGLKKRLYLAGFERRNYDAAHAVFGLTRTECEQIVRLGTKTAIYEVGNGIEVQPPAPSAAAVGFRLRHRITPQQPVILFVGRITHKKGIHYLLDALDAIRKPIPEVVLVICGGRDQDRDYVISLDRQVEQLQLGGHVRWAGFVDEIEKRAAFASCTVFAHPSYSEGMAMALLESMSFGVPTVVTPGCYMDSAVEAGAVGLAQQTVASLTEVIMRLLQDRHEAARLGATGRTYVAKNHAWPAIAGRLARIYTGEPEPAPYRGRITS